MGPGLTETYDTPDYLKAAGIRYIADWVYDDEPTEIATRTARWSRCPTRWNATTFR